MLYVPEAAEPGRHAMEPYEPLNVAGEDQQANEKPESNRASSTSHL